MGVAKLVWRQEQGPRSPEGSLQPSPSKAHGSDTVCTTAQNWTRIDGIRPDCLQIHCPKDQTRHRPDPSPEQALPEIWEKA